MGFISTKETNHNNNNTHISKGMAFLFVFFPENSNDSSSSSSPATAAKTSLFRFRSSRLLLLSKAQSTISICLLLFLITLFIFALSSFEPNPSDFPAVSHRRFLLNRHVDDIVATGSRGNNNRFALQGMGTLFLRGTKAMHDLIVAHVVSDATEEDLRLFLRLLHRSGVTSKSDVVLLFDSPSSSSSRFVELIEEENKSFFKLVAAHRNSPSSNKIESIFGFNISQFMKKEEETTSEPIWGKKKKKKKNESITELTHGSVVSFDVNELDPENSLSGFIEQAPISLRRWAWYPLLLGRIRRSFRHVLLVDAQTSLIVGDPFTRIRNRSSDSVLFFPSGGRKRVAEINPTVLIGGAKGIRGLASTMHTEIVSTTMKQLQDKRKKNSVVESVVLSQLVGNVYKDKGFQVVVAGEFVVEASSLAEFKKRNSVATSSSSLIKEHDIIQRRINGNSIF